jgi:tetratricopeptide (TPR) repeat protein
MQLKQAKDRKLSIFALSCLISFIFFNIAYCEEKINSYEVFGLRKAKTGKLTEAKANLLKAAQQNKDPQNSTAKKLADTIDDAKNNKINRKTAILILSGQDAANKGQTEKAIADFKAAIAKDPNYPQTYYYLGKLYLSMDNKAAALDAFKSCLKFAPKDSMLAKETEKIIADLENKKEEE